MFNFSSKTEINKKFKLTDIFRQINASKEARKESMIIDSIFLKYLISPKTLNCSDNVEIKELYIFEINVNTRVIPEKFIKEFDNSFKGQTMFLINNDGYTYALLSFKKGKFKNKYYSSNWDNKDNFDIPLLPNVKELYKFIISKFLPYNYFEKEGIEEYILRVEEIKKIENKIYKVKMKMDSEVQSKTRFELNDEYKELCNLRDSLLSEEN